MKNNIVLVLLCIVTSSSCRSYHRLFKKQKASLAGEQIVTNPKDLARVAKESADFLSKIHKSRYVTADVGVFEKFGVTLDQVQKTLEFIAQTAETKPKLLASPWFYNKYFTFYRWYGDATQQKEKIPRGWKSAPEHIRTTQYRITEILGLHNRKEPYIYPLYTLPKDEMQFTPLEKEKHKKHLVRFKYTRDQVLQRVPEKEKQSIPLAWVTEKGYKEFMLQGSALVVFSDGTKKLLRTVGGNEKLKKQQYWYASEVAKRPKNSAFPVKVKPRADVSYAADIKLLGFGKLILLIGLNPKTKRKETRLGVLVDTGEAFKGNLSKLDMFTGYFPDAASFRKHIKTYPHTAEAYILIKK
jgi:membrane-bound lytic murein transglycosylase